MFRPSIDPSKIFEQAVFETNSVYTISSMQDVANVTNHRFHLKRGTI